MAGGCLGELPGTGVWERKDDQIFVGSCIGSIRARCGAPPLSLMAIFVGEALACSIPGSGGKT